MNSLASIQHPKSRPEQVSVIIPLYNGGAVFRKCLDSLLACQPQPGEILVVADGEGDGVWTYAEGKGVSVIHTGHRRGPAAARNAGARAANGKILLFLDADVIVPTGLLGCLCAEFHEHPEAVALFGSYDENPLEPGLCSQYRNLFHHYVHQQGEAEASTFWGACGAIDRTVFLQAGGFDEAYTMPAVEDIELGYRLKKSGHRIRLCKKLQVKHGKRWSFLSVLKTDFRDRALPWTALLLRYRQFAPDLNLGYESRASVVCVFLFCCTVVLSFYTRYFLFPSLILCLALLGLNWRLYAFFARIRGAVFVLRAVPMHWLYYLCGGIAFACGILGYGYRKAFGGRFVAVGMDSLTPDP